jgi:hypothetical protein
MRGKELVEKMIHVLKDQYRIEGDMTLRRCWYVLLGRGLVHERAPIPGRKMSEAEKSSPYRSLSRILLKARIEGLLPWHIITDRTRRFVKVKTFDSVDDAVAEALDNFSYDPEKCTSTHIEVWIEKDAVSSIYMDVAMKYFVPLVVSKGFLSGTIMHDAAERFNRTDKPITILYMSDLDPEGEYFPRAVKEALRGKYGCTKNVSVEKLLLSGVQVHNWKLDTIPLYVSKRHEEKEYVRRYVNGPMGYTKVEMDAVSNVTGRDLLEKRLKELVDVEAIEKTTEDSEKAAIEWAEDHEVKM